MEKISFIILYDMFALTLNTCKKSDNNQFYDTKDLILAVYGDIPDEQTNYLKIS